MVESLILTTLILSVLITFVSISSNLDRLAKKLLTTFFGCIALQAGIKYLGFTNPSIIHSYPFLLILPELTSILIPEIIYLLVLFTLGKKLQKNLYYKLAILPLLSIVLFSVFYIITSGFTTGNKYYVFEAFIGMMSLAFVANILFFLVCLREIQFAFTYRMKDLSKHNYITLVWIKWLLWLLLIRALFSLTFFTLQFLFAQAEWFPMVLSIQKTAVAVIILVALLLTAYYGLRNPMLFDTITETPTVEQTLAISILTPEVKKVIQKSIKEDDIVPFLERITASVEESRLYLKADLTPSILAEMVGLPVYKLTFILNKGAGKNFNEFINSFRIAHARALLENPEHNKMTVFAVALESGFSSEAPFYVAFKKLVGQSPSAYRNAYQTKVKQAG